MGKFNSTAATHNKTTNLAGGSAYTMTPELELVSSLLTSFLKDTYYQSDDERADAIKASFAKVDPLFAAKAAIFARNEYGMRSVTHLIAGEIAATVKGQEWTKFFFDKIVRRPDDMTEILSYYYANHGKNEPHALRKGFAKAFGRFDDYQLAKYRAAGKDVKLVDVVNIVHPEHTDSIRKLVNDELRNTATYESKLSATGGDETAKAEAWGDLLISGRLGYMALLKNLRNIAEQAPEAVDLAVTQLTNAKEIRKSLVLPFRYLVAANELRKLPGTAAKKMLQGIAKALDVSCENVPHFEGETLVAIDTSYSMSGDPIEKAALFGAMLVKSNFADVLLWDTRSNYLNLDPSDSVTTMAAQIVQSLRGGGTALGCAFQGAARAYNRIIVLTDEQSWAATYPYGYVSGPQALAEYRQRTGANPMVYNWDLAGLGSLQFPETQVATLAGWSDKVFDIMKLVETDKKALVNKIKAIEL